ncbi:MAG: hypothetical protein Q9184_003646, partial [Pyrenodesmia sp. 2 TL-2023]
MPLSTSATAHGTMVYYNDLVTFIQSGRDWVSNLAKPGVISKASEDIEKLLQSTESYIRLLGGNIPSPLGGCSNSSKHKRRAGLFTIVQDLISDALSLARCVEAIAEDLSTEIRQLINQPPGPEIVQLIEKQLDALKQVSEEQEDGHSSTADSASSAPESTLSTTPSPSPSSSTASSSSTTVGSCSATYAAQADNDDNAPEYRRSLKTKARRYSAPVLIERMDSELIEAIGVCNFPIPVSAKPPPYWQFGKFLNSGKFPQQNKGDKWTDLQTSGNQIQGTCQQAVHPPASPNSGPLLPVCAIVDSKTGPIRINFSKARQAAQEFCHSISSEHTVLNSEYTAVGPWIVHGAAEHGGDLALRAIYDTKACSVWKEIEFSKAGEMECYRNFFEYISQMCTQDPTWKAVYNPEHTLEGGTVVQGYAVTSPPHSLKRKRSTSDCFEYDPSAQSINLDLLSSLTPIEYTGPSQFSQSISSLQRSPSARTTPSSNSSILPLTSDNLRKLHQEKGIMADFSTPNKSSGTSKGNTSSMSADVGQVRQILHLNGLRMDDPAAAETFEDYINEARDLLTNPRHSETSKQLLQGINKIRINYADRNETTFTNKFFGVFQSQSRHVEQAAQGSRNQGGDGDQGEELQNIDQGDLLVPKGWAARDWADDGLDANYNRVFQAGSVPKLDSIDENYKSILDKLPRISKPQPDLLYGTSIKNHYTIEEQAVIAQHKAFTQISPGLACPFLDGEIKTHGDFEEAANQANSGGAAMVNAHRGLKFLAQLATSKAKIHDTATAPESTTATASRSTNANPPKATTTPSGAKTTSTPNVPTVNTTSKASKSNSKATKADFSTKAYSLVLQP